LGAVVLALLFCLTVVIPRVLEEESIQARIRDGFPLAAGGSIEFDRLGLSLFPRPGVVIHGAAVRLPEFGRGTIESVKACPRIVPLLRGRVRIGELRIEGASFELDTTGIPLPGISRAGSDTSEALKKKASSLFEFLASKAPDLEVTIDKGRVDLLRKGQAAVSVRDLHATAVLPPKGPEIRLRCTSSLWQDLSLRGRLDARTLHGAARIELSRLQPHPLAAPFLAKAGITCPESMLYLRADVRTHGLQDLQGEIRASVPGIILRRDQEDSVIAMEALGTSFSIDREKIEISLDQMKLARPRMSLSGGFRMDRAAPDVRLALEARNLDVDEVRKIALSLGGDIRLVREIFGYVRGGEIPVITFQSRAGAPGLLFRDEAFRIQGRLLAGKIHIERPGLDMEEVRGDVDISNSLLQGKNLEARLENSRASRGNLRVGLKGKDAPFHLDINVNADMADVKRSLVRIVKPGTFTRELSRVENIEGRALGTMTLGESLQAVQAKVDVSECSMSADYARIPYRIRIEAGKVHYETDRIGGANMRGTLGNSSFSGVTFELTFGEDPGIEIRSGALRLFVDEIFPWVTSYESLRDDLRIFRDLKGKIEMAGMRLSGPVLRPADWDFETEATLENLTVETPLVPRSFPIEAGRLTARPGELLVKDLRARPLDASISAPSGLIVGYLAGLSKAEIALEGSIGPEFVEWVSGIVRLPQAFTVRTPLFLKKANMAWNREGETSFQGDFVFLEDVNASLDLSQGPGGFFLRSLSFEDRGSRAVLSAFRTGDTLGFHFAGDLARGTTDKVFASSPLPDLYMKGDFLLNIRRENVPSSEAKGRLQAGGFSFPYGWLSLFRIESLSLEAAEDGIRFDSSRLTLEESGLALQGSLSFAPEGIRADLDLASEEIPWDRIRRVVEKAKEPEEKKTPFPLPPVRGTFRCRTESFTYGKLTWKPMHATVTFLPDAVGVAVTRAALCGISTLGAVELKDDETRIDCTLNAQEADLNAALPCLSESERQVTGSFNLSGSIRGTAREEALMRALQGELAFTARNGDILRNPVLAKVFSVLNGTEILRGKVPDLRSNQLPYKSLEIKATLQNGALALTEVALSGPTVGIAGSGTADLIDRRVDLQLLVAPLRTVDFIVEKTPLVGNIMGGKLVTVPVRISGDWDDPDVTLLAAGAVGNRLLDIMKNTLMLPVDLAEQVLPDQKGK
jgi:hypothetical protein